MIHFYIINLLIRNIFYKQKDIHWCTREEERRKKYIVEDEIKDIDERGHKDYIQMIAEIWINEKPFGEVNNLNERKSKPRSN